MKNFTKQNFKTNPLWIRLLIMTFMLLGAVVPQSAMAVGHTKNLNIGYNANGSDHWTTNITNGGTIALGELESAPKLIGINAYTTKYNGGNICSGSVSVEGATYNSSSINWNYNNSSNDQEFWFSINRTLSSTVGDHSITVTVTIKGGASSSSCSTSYTRTFKITYTIKETEKEYSLGGYLNGGDKAYNDTFKLTKQNDGTYKGTFNNFTTGTHYFQVFDDLGTKWGVNSYTTLTVGSSVTLNKTDNGEKVGVSLTNGTSYVFTFNPSDGSFSIKLACTSANFSVSLSNSSVTVGQANIKASITGTHFPAVTWSSLDKNIATIDANGNITAKKYGKVTITATTNGTDSYCSGTLQSAELTVKETPTISISGETTFCGTSTTLTADISGLTAANTDGKTIKWYKDGGASSVGTGPTYNATETGTYTAKITGTYIEEKTSDGFSVTKKATPTAANFTVTNNTYTYDGAAKAATVKWTDNQSAEGITVTYNPTTPKDADIYDIQVTTTAHGDLCASDGAITLDTKLTINKKTPEATDFVYANQTVTYNGEIQSVDVKWKSGYEKTGAITITYKQGEEVKDPINAGTYDVWVTSAASDNFNATESAIEKGTLTIDCAQITDVENNFVLSNTSYNYGEPAKPTVSLKQNSTLVQAGLGAITTKYYNSSDEEVANPTAVGRYTVKISIEAGTGYCALTETAVGDFTISCPEPAKVPTLSKTDVQRCNGVTGTKGTITITNYSTDYNGGNGYKFLLGDSFEPTIGNDGVMGEIDFDGDSETYKVQVAKVCGSSISEYVNSTIEVNAINTVPTISLDPTSAPVCEGATFANIADYVTVTTNGDRVGWYEQASGGDPLGENVAIKQTTYYAEANIGDCKSERAPFEVTYIMKAPEVPVISPSKNTICEGESVDITLVSREDGVTYTMNSSMVFIENETYNTGALNGNTSFILTATNSCGSTNSAELAIAVDKSPTFTAPAATQINKEVTLTSAAGASTQWSVSPTDNVTLTDNGDGTATFVAIANGDYTITASNGVCAQVSHTIKVSDAFYIWVRNAKKGETAYSNFYYSNQNSEKYRGGEIFYAECDALPTNDTYTTYNEGGRTADIVQNDCDGYTWYAFKASDEVIAGTKYFYVHAKNDLKTDGWYTHTVPTKVTLTSDVYYTLCETSVSECNEGSKGWKIESASAPYAGPMVHASGSTTLGTNKFVALYVTDCSGKEIISYQWYKDGNPYNSICSYTFEGKEKVDVVNPETGETEKKEVKVIKTGNGDAGTSNNIRATEAGNYTCKITYKDESSKTSESFPVAGTYSYLSSTIPVIVVNTNNVEFPGCQGDNETASKNASKMKEKLSVDVKIYDGSTVVYDRKARMAYRGSSSLNFQKKSYAFCPGKADCVEDKGRLDYVKTEKMNMLGIGQACDKDWVLYAAAADPSMMRNRMVFDTYKAMTGEWGVNCRYVELIINGDYRGVYVMMDKITQNKNRVDVEWSVTDASKRGFILKFDKTDREDRVGGFEGEVGDEKTFITSYSGKFNINTYDTTNDQAFEIEYPEKEDIEDESGNWDDVVDFIKGKVNEFETALAAGKFSEVQKVIDYESWADWFILNEFTKNVDAYRASCVFTFDGNKLKANPLWDQELSFNNQSVHANRSPGDGGNKGCENVTGLLINHDHVYTDGFAAPFWFTGTKTELNTDGKGCTATKNAYSGLLKDPCFVEVIKQRWNTHKAEALSYSSLNGLITEYKKELTDAVLAREAAFWTDNEYSRNTLSCSWSGNNTGYYDDTFTDAETDIQNWIKDATASGSTGRRDGLSKAIANDLKGSEISILIEPATVSTTPWEPVTIQVQSESGYEYELTYEGDNPLNEVNNVIIEKNGNAYKYHIPRPISWGVGDAAEGVRTPINYVIKATLKVGEEGNVCGSTTDGGAPFGTTTITLNDEDNDGCQ